MQARPSRQLWVAAIVVSIVCVGALAWGVFNYWDEPPRQHIPTAAAGGGGSGFGLGLMIGIGAGILIGSVIALRKRS
ncbi:MAG TPA: hypothetical protein VFS15_11965 [Kofleriaceae bacterium]|nr:hypothetical protein [Kofleriaceae bacterium]